jgi:L-iditol 2-dehydrogenase
MIALVKLKSGPGHVDLMDMPEPNCAPNQVKLAVEWCGVCGTDIHVCHDSFRNFPPVILGHEFAGKIVETGSHVRRFKPGHKVAVLGAMTVVCGHCNYCRRGEFMFCPDRRGMGHGVHGGFTRYVVAREEQLFQLPPSLDSEVGAMIEPFAVAVHVVCEIAKWHLGDVALLSGPGPIGLMCLKLLVAQGTKTIVVGTSADKQRLEKARELGAAATVNIEEQELLDVVRSLTNGLGVDCALECAGSEGSAANCLRAVRPLGRYVQVGHFGTDVLLPFDLIAFKQLRAAGSVGYNAATWTRAIQILAQGQVTLSDLISHRLPLDQWRTGFAACENKSALKVLLNPNPGHNDGNNGNHEASSKAQAASLISTA